MNRLVAVVGVAASLLFLSAGTASADPDVIGKTYGEAKSLLGQAGLNAVVATVVGDRAASKTIATSLA